MCHQSTLLETGACYSIFGTQDLHNALNSRTNVKPLVANWSKKNFQLNLISWNLDQGFYFSQASIDHLLSQTLVIIQWHIGDNDGNDCHPWREFLHPSHSRSPRNRGFAGNRHETSIIFITTHCDHWSVKLSSAIIIITHRHIWLPGKDDVSWQCRDHEARTGHPSGLIGEELNPVPIIWRTRL